MNKKDLIDFSVELRRKKDKAKEFVKSGQLNEKQVKCRIIIPKQLFDTSLELQSDQWYFNGFIIDCEGKLIVVDPGVDFYSRFSSTGLQINDIQALIVTHGHIDHTASLQIMIEKLLRNKSKRIDIFISQDAYNSKVPSYYHEQLSKSEHIKVVILSDNRGCLQDEILGKYKIEFLPLFHSCPDTFGFKMNINGKKLGYIADTGYSIKIKTTLGVYCPNEFVGKFISIEEKHTYIRDFFSDVEANIVNINDIEYNRHSKYHLCARDVEDILKGTKTQQLILQHISPVNIEGEDSNYLYKLFFKDEPYQVVLPHYLGRTIFLW